MRTIISFNSDLKICLSIDLCLQKVISKGFLARSDGNSAKKTIEVLKSSYNENHKTEPTHMWIQLLSLHHDQNTWCEP